MKNNKLKQIDKLKLSLFYHKQIEQAQSLSVTIKDTKMYKSFNLFTFNKLGGYIDDKITCMLLCHSYVELTLLLNIEQVMNIDYNVIRFYIKESKIWDQSYVILNNLEQNVQSLIKKFYSGVDKF